MHAGLFGDMKTTSPQDVARRFKEIIAATEWGTSTQLFDLVFADLVDHVYQAPRLFTYVDLFCGAGGSSIGLTMAGGMLRLAANHSRIAIDTHSKNFRDADHECADLNHYDMRKLPTADVLWVSPICTEISPAGGKGRAKKPGKDRAKKPRQQRSPGQEELMKFGPIPEDVFERTRATFHDVIRAAEVHAYPFVIVENVPEAATEWRLFWWWMQGMIYLGYEWQILCVSAAHVGDDTNPHAAQRRDRIYIVFNKIGVPKPDLAVRPQSWCDECGPVFGVQSWKKKQGTKTASGVLLPVGKYGPRTGQYVYRCPNLRCARVVTPLERPAASIIDWSNLGLPIGERKQNGEKELVPNTLNRVLRGMNEHRRPVVATVAGNTFERPGYTRAWPADATPLMTRQCTRTDAVVTPESWLTAWLDSNGGSWNTGPDSVGRAFRTRTTKQWEALVTCEEPAAPLIDVARAHSTPRPAHTDALATVSTARHNALVVPYYRTGVAKPATAPLPTMTTKDRCAFSTHADQTGPVTMDDVMRARYRMITAEEAARAQRFPLGYVITGNDGARMAQVGNAVCTNVAQFIGERVAEALNRTSAHV